MKKHIELTDPEARPAVERRNTVSTYLSDEFLADVERRAKAQHLSVAAYIRAALLAVSRVAAREAK